MRRGAILSALALAAAALAGHAQAATCTLAGLGWMAGDWRNAKTPDRAQERWVAAPDHVLMGSSFEFPEGKGGYAEAMTVRPDGAGIVMVLRHFDGGLARAWEDKAAPMVFAAASCEPDRAVFDGQGEHAGEHLTYARSGTTLLIVGDFLHKGVPDREEWRMVRAGN
jgi:hypothetical protein